MRNALTGRARAWIRFGCNRDVPARFLPRQGPINHTPPGKVNPRSDIWSGEKGHLARQVQRPAKASVVVARRGCCSRSAAQDCWVGGRPSCRSGRPQDAQVTRGSVGGSLPTELLASVRPYFGRTGDASPRRGWSETLSKFKARRGSAPPAR